MTETEADLFYLPGARQAREAINDVFEITQPDYLAKARAVAIRHAELHGTVTIDDVRRVCPVPKNVSPNVLGSVFCGKLWKCTGITTSSRVAAHGRMIRVWQIAKKEQRHAQTI